jgi:mersacidin/lichenicidin family type 2 lantibiotic
MDRTTIIRAWKDPAFRASLNSEQRAALPESPSGKPMTEVSESELEDVVGGGVPLAYNTKQLTVTKLTITKPSLVDGCPSALSCPDWRSYPIREFTPQVSVEAIQF